MPDMGIGNLGSISFINRVRWTFQATFPFGKITERFVKVSSRPQRFQDKWEPIEVTICDFSDADIDLENPEFWNTINICNENAKQNKFEGKGKIVLYTAYAHILETWEFLDLKLKSLYWGELDHSSTEITDVTLRWQFEHCFHNGFLI